MEDSDRRTYHSAPGTRAERPVGPRHGPCLQETPCRHSRPCRVILLLSMASTPVDAIAIPPVERFCNEGGVLATLIQNGLCLLCPLPTSTGEQCSIFIAG